MRCLVLSDWCGASADDAPVGLKRGPLRNCIALVIVLLFACHFELHAQNLFYEAYDRGIKAYNAGDLPTAARMFERALQLDPKQARRKRFQGMVFRDYLPDYYLALISM